MRWSTALIEKQPPSTRSLMLAQNSRPEEEDVSYINLIRFTPVDIKAQCVKEDGTVDLNVRELTQQEADFHQGIRSKRGAAIEGLRGSAQSIALSEERRERAAAAFMRVLSLDALKDRFKSMMKELFKPSYAEVMADAIKKAKDEK